MKIADYHLHSQFSKDGMQTIDDACNKAIQLGISELCFTDHLEFAENYGVDYPEYRRSIETAQMKFQKELSLKVGLEIGFDKRAQQQINTYLEDKDFDFLIGSLHRVDELDLFNGEFFRGKRVQDAIKEYFQALQERISLFDFSVLGHITLFKRFFGQLKVSSSDFNWSDYDELIRAILKDLIDQGKGIELNMRVPLIDLDFRILRHYKELGGKIITLGSDAHHIRSMHTMKEGFQALQDVGFRYYCVFEHRKPLFINIED